MAKRTFAGILILSAVLILLKLLGPAFSLVGRWSWYQVTAPLWGPWAVLAAAAFLLFLFSMLKVLFRPARKAPQN